MGVGAAISNVRLREETVDLLGMKRQHAPVALVVTALGTIILSIIVSIASGDYYDGLSVPFISYVGRDEPSYYVFAVGMSLSGAGVAVVAVGGAAYRS